MTDDISGAAGARPATIYDVARAAGVSIATVSNVLNRPERVGAATRERVIQAADELRYMPKSEAAIRARARIGRIAVAAPFSVYPSYLRRLVGVLRGLNDRGFEVVIIDEESAAMSRSPVLATLPVRGSIDGLIAMGRSLADATEQRLVDRSLPVVVVDATSPRFSAVMVDDFEGGRLAAVHLIELGHRRLGYILERQVSEYDSQARRRLDGVRQAVGEIGGEVIAEGAGGSVADGGRAARALLDRDPGITAVMAHYDDLAIGALEALRTTGLRVPDDISLMGYDDGLPAEAAGLSTVRQPFEETGVVAAGLLIASLDGERSRSTTQLPTELVVRRTSGRVRSM